ncbi:hypothetical protein [Gilliamella apicola]|uniref:hypothetical protein n=1 Tax=Gilliamella apicola TaxID=1196095 RepID=UPI00155625BA|nr:hypothetical protein [Gilliamella apicola]
MLPTRASFECQTEQDALKLKGDSEFNIDATSKKHQPSIKRQQKRFRCQRWRLVESE